MGHEQKGGLLAIAERIINVGMITGTSGSRVDEGSGRCAYPGPGNGKATLFNLQSDPTG